MAPVFALVAEVTDHSPKMAGLLGAAGHFLQAMDRIRQR
jgi:hypothetical protein